MHQSSYDRMADFCRDYLSEKRAEALTIVDLGSCDYNGSYRPIFAQPPWHYIGVDLAPGKNVDLVLREPYHWRELKSESVDVVISGQTFEHTEFFWETMLEIARVLKPRGLCCIIAPATGIEHRFPSDCWRILTDGFRALARFAQLEILHSRTHWEELPTYDYESNKWHESILIARKPLETVGSRVRRRLYTSARRWLRPLPQTSEALIQVFYTSDGIHREDASIIAGFAAGQWENVLINLPPNAAARPLRIDLMRALGLVELAELRVSSQSKEYFCAKSRADFERISVTGDAERLPDADLLRLKITGVDPQLILPVFEIDQADRPLRVALRLRLKKIA